jgi:hypothetical protein
MCHYLEKCLWWRFLQKHLHYYDYGCWWAPLVKTLNCRNIHVIITNDQTL